MPQVSLDIVLRADSGAVVQGTENASVRVLLNLRPGQGKPVSRPPATLVALLDCSGTTRRFLFADDNSQALWMDVARARGELHFAESDQRRGYQFSGQSLVEARRSSQCALATAAAALRSTTSFLRSSDVCCLIGFATEAGMLHDGRRHLLGRSLEDTLDAIQANPSAPGLGDGTRLEQAARMSASILSHDSSKKRVRRLIIITDGIVEDQSESLIELERIKNEGIAVTAIGIGQEFDEEFLIRLADWTGGSYYYAATAADIETKLAEEFGALSSVAAREMRLSARGMGGAVVTSVTQVTPQMRMFDEIRLKDDWFQVEVGDVGGAAGIGLMAEFSLPWLSLGPHAVGELLLEWTDPESGEPQQSLRQVSVSCLPAGASMPEVDSGVDDMAIRLQVYREERAAQWAQEGGRRGLSTIRLRAASQLLRKLGEAEMAEQMEQQARDVEGDEIDAGRTKTVKDWVRRLGRKDDQEI